MSSSSPVDPRSQFWFDFDNIILLYIRGIVDQNRLISNFTEKAFNHAKQDEEGNTILHRLTETGPHLIASSGLPPGNVQVIAKLNGLLKYCIVEHHLNPNVCNNKWQTPLHIAARSNFLEGVKFLIGRSGIIINPRDFMDDTPLHYAVRENNIKISEVLLSNYADPSAVNRNGQTPISIAKLFHANQLKELLVLSPQYNLLFWVDRYAPKKRSPLHKVETGEMPNEKVQYRLKN